MAKKKKAETAASRKKKAAEEAKADGQRKKKQRTETGEESEEDDDYEDIRAHLANQESRIAQLQQQMTCRGKKKHDKRQRSASQSSSSSSSSKSDSSRGSFEIKDPDVENWRPGNWPRRTDALRAQLQHVSTRMLALQPPGYIVSEIDFITELVDEMGAGASKSKLQGIIGKRIILTLTKLEAKGDYASIESSLKSKMMGKKSKLWASARAKVLADARAKRTGSGSKGTPKGKSFRFQGKKRQPHDKREKQTKNE